MAPSIKFERTQCLDDIWAPVFSNITNGHGLQRTPFCHWLPTTAFVIRHRHVRCAVNQDTSWRSLICCCWTSCMEQSANPAAIVRHYSWTISTSTQNASVWLLTAAVSSGSVFRALCANWLTYLLIIIFYSQEVESPGVKNRVKTSWNCYMSVSSSAGKVSWKRTELTLWTKALIPWYKNCTSVGSPVR